VANAILSAEFFERHRLVVTQERFLRIGGRLQAHDGTVHVRAASVSRLDTRGLAPVTTSHDFH
jgi:hypothetical protein